MKKQQLQNWISENRPDLGLHEVKEFGKKGYYRLDAGPAASFKGFDSWQDVHDHLAD